MYLYADITILCEAAIKVTYILQKYLCSRFLFSVIQLYMKHFSRYRRSLNLELIIVSYW